MEKFNLQENVKEELLKLFQYILPYENKLPKTIHKLEKAIGLEKTKVFESLFCQECKLEISKDLNAQNICSCVRDQTLESDRFLYINVFDQIECLVNRYYKTIQSYLSKKRDFIDLCDGNYYKSIAKEETLHLIVCADGTPVRKTTKLKQFWPVVLSLCELPLSLRDSIKNKIICGNNFFYI